jgi:hypothetical protein
LVWDGFNSETLWNSEDYIILPAEKAEVHERCRAEVQRSCGSEKFIIIYRFLEDI